MSPITIEISQRKAAKAAGFMFLFIVTGWILNWTFVDSKLAAAGNATAAAVAALSGISSVPALCEFKS